MYLDFKVKIPDSTSGITRKTIKGVTYIYYTYNRSYDSGKKFSVPKNTSIGKCAEDDPDMMYLVVCGGSQSIKYIRKATLIDAIENFEIPENKYPLSEGDRHTTLYRFRVQLELSDFARTIHILGNVDENQLITGSYSYQSLPNMLSFDNKQAYWQKLVVPHIKAKMDPDTQEPIVQNGSYVPDDETLGFFQYIPLIRNFAKIQVTNASENFQLHSYAVIYYPERGSVVPYRSNEPVAVNRFDFKPSDGYLLSGYERARFTSCAVPNPLA